MPFVRVRFFNIRYHHFSCLNVSACVFVFLTVFLLMLGYMHAHIRTHIDALAKRAQMPGRRKDVQVRGRMGL